MIDPADLVQARGHVRYPDVPPGSFLEMLLAGDVDGQLAAIVEADRADLAAGVLYLVLDRHTAEPVGTGQARYLADMARHEVADLTGRPVRDFVIWPEDEPLSARVDRAVIDRWTPPTS